MLLEIINREGCTLSDVLAYVIKHRYSTYTNLASVMGLGEVQVGRLSRGDSHSCGEKWLPALAKDIEVPLNRLFYVNNYGRLKDMGLSDLDIHMMLENRDSDSSEVESNQEKEMPVMSMVRLDVAQYNQLQTVDMKIRYLLEHSVVEWKKLPVLPQEHIYIRHMSSTMVGERAVDMTIPPNAIVEVNLGVQPQSADLVFVQFKEEIGNIYIYGKNNVEESVVERYKPINNLEASRHVLQKNGDLATKRILFGVVLRIVHYSLITRT